MEEPTKPLTQFSARNRSREYERSLNVPEIPVMELLGGEIKRLRERGYTLEQIAEKGGVTRERIRQVIKKYYPGVKPRLLSVSQVAKRFGVAEFTIKGFMKRGLVHPVRRGNIYRYDGKALEEVKAALSKPCRICGSPVAPGNTKLCEKCSVTMRNWKLRLVLPGEREKHKKAMKRWQEKAKRQTEVPKRNRGTSVYMVRRIYPGFKVGEQFKAVGLRDGELLLDDGRTITTSMVIKVSPPNRRTEYKDFGRMG